ncbi:MAG: AMP-binding protein [Propionibacteriaceae bacterium]|nr:AMP-binding protein [Propionibacteriaceae bacterium]
MQEESLAVAEFLDGGPGLWLAPGSGVPPADCAVVATSGSTGDAKLVVLHREALVAAARAAEERLGFAATWHLTLAPQYVAGLMVLVRGLLGDGVRAASSDLADLELVPGRNCLSVVGTQLYRALESQELAETLARFDAVLVGGAALRPELRARAEHAGIRVIETYGMSETCGGVVWDGVPLPGVEITLGDRGRVEIAGPMVFEGYLGEAGLEGRAALRRRWLASSQATLRDQQDTQRVLTNDRGRWEGDRLIIEGRVDDVIISGGVNVDLAAVRRAVLAVDPEAEVLAVDDAEWGARVVLFAPSGTLDGWRETLRSALPPAALPRQLVIVKQLPRTGGGKPDRKSLLELVQS